jgi:hypothetical protein
MKDLKQLLVEGDPIAREPWMSGADVQAMRRTIFVEARRQLAPASVTGSKPLALRARRRVPRAGRHRRPPERRLLSTPLRTPVRDIRRSQ